MRDDPLARPGRLREEQSWIGGRLGNPMDAAYIPPPEDLVPELLEDLVTFLARDDLPAVAQAAIAHARSRRSIHSSTGTVGSGAA
jgi:Fic family protein